NRALRTVTAVRPVGTWPVATSRPGRDCENAIEEPVRGRGDVMSDWNDKIIDDFRANGGQVSASAAKACPAPPSTGYRTPGCARRPRPGPALAEPAAPLFHNVFHTARPHAACVEGVDEALWLRCRGCGPTPRHPTTPPAANSTTTARSPPRPRH